MRGKIVTMDAMRGESPLGYMMGRWLGVSSLVCGFFWVLSMDCVSLSTVFIVYRMQVRAFDGTVMHEINFVLDR